ncbi:hypothetical protein LZ32DRAFT_31886 [Colletotrichum eremochloae]|nr:hypothetical protein LZ32DRAFT_31886 [Colletotrichum eremochloae]
MAVGISFVQYHSAIQLNGLLRGTKPPGWRARPPGPNVPAWLFAEEKERRRFVHRPQTLQGLGKLWALSHDAPHERASPHVMICFFPNQGFCFLRRHMASRPYAAPHTPAVEDEEGKKKKKKTSQCINRKAILRVPCHSIVSHVYSRPALPKRRFSWCQIQATLNRIVARAALAGWKQCRLSCYSRSEAASSS